MQAAERREAAEEEEGDAKRNNISSARRVSPCHVHDLTITPPRVALGRVDVPQRHAFLLLQPRCKGGEHLPEVRVPDEDRPGALPEARHVQSCRGRREKPRAGRGVGGRRLPRRRSIVRARPCAVLRLRAGPAGDGGGRGRERRGRREGEEKEKKRGDGEGAGSGHWGAGVEPGGSRALRRVEDQTWRPGRYGCVGHRLCESEESGEVTNLAVSKPFSQS